MHFAKTYSAQITGLRAEPITVEVDISKGTLHAFSIVGLPDKAVEEARDRISSAIKHAGFSSPKSQNQKIVISLAPGDVKKEGPLFDLPMALAYVAASGDLSFNPEGKLFLGELSLDGNVRPIKGALVIAKEAKKRGFTELFVPKENAREAALIHGIQIIPVGTLSETIKHLSEKDSFTLTPHPEEIPLSTEEEDALHFGDISGQETAKRGLLIAAAGGHNVALIGPPGTGKTMLARAFQNLLPPLSFDEMLEVTGIHSVAGSLSENLLSRPPFRSPHHTSSYTAIVGGGTIPKPGEITLAHRGVLFLDEFPEFEKRVIEALRQPLEDRIVSIARVRGSDIFPANTLLVAAMNPCPCGYRNSRAKKCECSASSLEKYKRKLSGPIVDRIDLWLSVPDIDHSKLSLDIPEDRTLGARMRKEVEKARAIQKKRLSETRATHNSEMTVRDLKTVSLLTEDAEKILQESAKALSLSGRSYHRIIKLARTIADLSESETILPEHILEALQYRPKELLS